MGRVTRLRPFQGQYVVRRLGLAMINMHTKLEVFIFTYYEDVMGNAKSKILGGLWGG